MKRKLNCVLLVDDDKDCNYFHERVLNKMQCVEKIEVAHDGVEALEFLKSIKNKLGLKPAIIFLDVNMPKMNGWEFLNEYEKLDEADKAEIIIVMLTSSLNPDDEKKAKSYNCVSGFLNKFLEEESVNKILKEHFPECIEDQVLIDN